MMDILTLEPDNNLRAARHAYQCISKSNCVISDDHMTPVGLVLHTTADTDVIWALFGNNNIPDDPEYLKKTKLFKLIKWKEKMEIYS